MAKLAEKATQLLEQLTNLKDREKLNNIIQVFEDPSKTAEDLQDAQSGASSDVMQAFCRWSLAWNKQTLVK